MKKAWNIISKIFVWLVVIIAVAVMIFTIVSTRTFNRNDRSILGYKAFIVLSDSMKATDFDAGDLVLIKQVDPTTLQEGDIIAFQSQDPASFNETITHKIRGKTVAPNGEPAFITYGTTTGNDDATPVTYPFIIGQYQFSIPKVGTFFQFLKTPQGYIICILVPFLMLILYQGLNTVKLFRRYKQEQMAELEAEKERIEAERRRSEEMMAQLLAMKDQLTAQNQTAAPPAQAAPAPAPAQGPDVAAMMAELEALRAQLAQKNEETPAQPAEAEKNEEEVSES